MLTLKFSSADNAAICRSFGALPQVGARLIGGDRYGAYEAAYNRRLAAAAALRAARAEYVADRARVGYANRRQPHLTAAARRAASHYLRAEAMRALNISRAALNRAEVAYAAARAALDALAPISVPLAA